jgi:hypothetical protein
MPVGRVKARNPLGHSGQRKLHEVVGSIEILMGKPQCNERLNVFEKWNEKNNKAAFQTFAMLEQENQLHKSFSFFICIIFTKVMARIKRK